MWEWQQEQLSCSGKHLQHNQRTYLCVFICPAAAAAGSVCQCAAGRIPCVWLQLLQASLHTLMCKSLLRSARTRAHLQAIVVPDIWFGLANLQAGRTTRQHLYCCYVTAAYMQWTLRRHSTLRLCIVGCIIQLKHLQEWWQHHNAHLLCLEQCRCNGASSFSYVPGGVPTRFMCCIVFRALVRSLNVCSRQLWLSCLFFFTSCGALCMSRWRGPLPDM